MRLTKYQRYLFKTLSEKLAISGLENEVAAFLKDQYQLMGYELVKDNLGSIFALKRSTHPNAKKVMVVGHMDEVGFIVVDILENGMVKVAPLGGINDQTLLAHRVILRGRYGDLKGCIGAIPPHLLKGADKDKPTKLKDMLFDFGMTSKQEAIDNGIFIGAMIVAEGHFEELNGGKRLLGKAFDDRYGLVLGLEVLKSLKDVDLPYDLYVGGSVQEEVGCRGAITATNLIHPDLAFVLDCSPSRDSSGDKNELGQLGEGVLLRVIDGNMIAFPELIDFQRACAKKAKVKVQEYISPGGTDAGNIHKQYDGVPTLTHCLCARNIHTSSTILDTADYLAAKKLLLYMLKHLQDNDFEVLGRKYR